MTISEAIRARRSIRKYKKGAEVTDAQAEQLLTAAMMAPSANNTRPWEFYVVRDRAKLDAIMAVHPYTNMLKEASLAIVICALPAAQAGYVEDFFPQDCGAAAENILLEAVGMGLGTCWCGVYPRNDRLAEIRNILGIGGKNVVPFNVIAVGVPDENPAPRGKYEKSKVTWM